MVLNKIQWSLLKATGDKYCIQMSYCFYHSWRKCLHPLSCVLNQHTVQYILSFRNLNTYRYTSDRVELHQRSQRPFLSFVEEFILTEIKCSDITFRQEFHQLEYNCASRRLGGASQFVYQLHRTTVPHSCVSIIT